MPAHVPQLNHKQRQFIKHYMGRDPKLHAHATNSYKAAYGLTDTRSAAVCGSKLLQNPLVRQLIAKATARLDEKIITDSSFVLKQSRRLYDRAMGDEAIPGDAVVTVDPETGEESVHVPETRQYDPATARQALQLIGQHKDVQAFSVTVEHSHTHRLEQRLAARSKVVEGRAGLIEHDPTLVAGGPLLPGPGVDDKAHADRAHTDRGPTSGGYDDSDPATERFPRESAGAPAK